MNYTLHVRYITYFFYDVCTKMIDIICKKSTKPVAEYAHVFLCFSNLQLQCRSITQFVYSIINRIKAVHFFS